jgi:hypothetical protein
MYNKSFIRPRNLVYWCNLIFLVSWVAVLNPLCVIVFVGPYRDAILRKKIIVFGAMYSSNWGLSNNISVNVVP